MLLLRNILAVIIGFIGGSCVNMAIIVFVSPLIPLPEGVDPNSMESIKANIAKFGFENFIAPFAAHARNAKRSVSDRLYCQELQDVTRLPNRFAQYVGRVCRDPDDWRTGLVYDCRSWTRLHAYGRPWWIIGTDSN